MASFGVASIAAIDYRTIEITFTNDVLVSAFNSIAVSSPGSYSISPGLEVLAARLVTGFPKVIRVYTTPQSAGALYTMDVVGAIRDSTSQSLVAKTGTWTALASPSKALVSGLEARSECQGKSVYLSWTNPAGTTRVKVVRRLRAWPFDLTDTHDVVYEGSPVTSLLDTGIATPSTLVTLAAAAGATSLTVASSSGFTVGMSVRVETLNGARPYDLRTVTNVPDATHVVVGAISTALGVGARVSRSEPLEAQTYYYYTVLASDDAGPYLYDIDNASRVSALSMDVYPGKQWFLDNVPKHSLELDYKATSEGGGGGFLDKWFTVMGCWLNLMRGNLNALKLAGDPDAAPFHVLPAKNLDFGISAEGFAYDFDIARRPLAALAYIYKRKGTCAGVVETVRMFTKWDAECREFGFNQCRGGPSDVKTWDGISQVDTGVEGAVTFVQKATSNDGTATFRDSSKAWGVNLWQEGTLRGWLGDIACVDTNTADTLTLLPPKGVTVLSADAVAPTVTLNVASTAGLRPGMTIQVTEVTDPGIGYYLSEILEIGAIAVSGAPGQLTLCVPTVNTFHAGSKVSIGKSRIRLERVNTASSVGQVMTDTGAKWTDGQWVGFKALDANNVKHNILSNTGTTITVDGAAPPAGPASYSIAYDFTLGAAFANRVPLGKYKVGNGDHSTWFEPTYDIEVRGTTYDPFNRLYNGPGAVLTGVFGPNDVAAYILTNVTVAQGQAASATGAVFTLDPSQPAPGVNAWVGYFLNPNQNQEQLFEILENDATTVTVAGDTSSLLVSGQYYYVLRPRDKVRFQRLTRRLRKEFTDTDVRVHVLFV